ncbi:unnamed protein product, partial [Ectocarpus sp. 13 AM-2016]
AGGTPSIAIKGFGERKASSLVRRQRGHSLCPQISRFFCLAEKKTGRVLVATAADSDEQKQNGAQLLTVGFRNLALPVVGRRRLSPSGGRGHADCLISPRQEGKGRL